MRSAQLPKTDCFRLSFSTSVQAGNLAQAKLDLERAPPCLSILLLDLINIQSGFTCPIDNSQTSRSM